MSAAAATIPPVLATLFALRKGSLSLSGLAASWLVGPITGWAGHALSAHLYGFFFLSSLATRVGEGAKRAIEGAAFKKGGRRTAAQVLCNGGFQTLVAALYILTVDRDSHSRCALPSSSTLALSSSSWARMLTAMHLSGYACAAGDTWASELGVLSKSLPRLVTAPWRVVPRGTNGGISLLGTVASGAGGASIGIAHVLCEILSEFWFENYQTKEKKKKNADDCSVAVAMLRKDHVRTRWHRALGVIAQSTSAGIFGSFVDSLLGATLQYTGTTPRGTIVNAPSRGAHRIVSNWNLLSNDQVNVAAIVLTMVFGGLTADWFHSAMAGRFQKDESNKDKKP